MKALPFIVLFLQLDILLATLHGLYTGTELAVRRSITSAKFCRYGHLSYLKDLDRFVIP